MLLYRRSVVSDSVVGHAMELLAIVAGCVVLGARLERFGFPEPWLTGGLFACVLAYPVVTLRYLEGTVGQRLFRVRVVATSGDPVTWKHAVRRAVGQLLSMALLMVTGPLGFIWLMVKRGRSGVWWHDGFAGTRLIRSGEPDPGPKPPPLPVSPERKRVILILAVSVVVGLTLIFSITAGVQHFLFAGSLHLLAPRDAELRVQLDGGPVVVLQAGMHTELKVKRGPHVVSLQARGEETTQTFETSGGYWQAFLSVEPNQCFVLLDVTGSHYGSVLADGTMPLPRLEQRYTPQLVRVSWPNDVFFDLADLPSASKYQVKLVAQLTCDALSQSDEELLRGTLGFKGRSWREINAGP